MAKRRSTSSGMPAVDMFWSFVENDPKRAVAMAFQAGAFLGQMVNKSDFNTGAVKRKFSSASGALADAIPNLSTILHMVPLNFITGDKPGPKEGSRPKRRKGRKTKR